jgi:cellulose synthase/poly-beta-1,6-N-acetylglucosamine synthase-like glycosyltransferase
MKHKDNVPGRRRRSTRCRSSRSSCRSTTRCTSSTGWSTRSAASTTRASASRSRCSTTRPTRRARSPSSPCAAAAQGFDIKYLHRTDRTGYKAGALDAGLKVARGEFIAIFDADFVPPPDFLERTLPHFADPGSAWCRRAGATSTATTRCSPHPVDPARRPLRARARRPQPRGLLLQLQRHGGRLAREAIEDAGGWQHDTLTEDLDLSYRAQLRGWRFVFLPDLVAPAEVPVEMNAFKSQQHRWAKGSVQTCRKLLPQAPGVRPAAAR